MCHTGTALVVARLKSDPGFITVPAQNESRHRVATAASIISGEGGFSDRGPAADFPLHDRNDSTAIVNVVAQSLR